MVSVKQDLREIRDTLKAFVSLTSLRTRQMWALMFFTLGATAVEGFGLVMFVPVVQFLEKGRDVGNFVAGTTYGKYLVAVLAAVGLPMALSTLMGTIFLLAIFRQAFVYKQSTYRSHLISTVLSDLQATGFARLVQADASFFARHSVGEIMNVLTLDGVRAGTILFFLSSMATSFLLFLFYTGALLLMSVPMTVLAAGIMAVVGLLGKARMGTSRGYGDKISRSNEMLSATLVERLSGIEAIKIAAAEEREAKFFGQLARTLRGSSYRLLRAGARIELMIDPIVILAVLSIFYVGLEVFHLSVAFLGLFIFAMLRLLPFTKTMLQSYQRFVGSLASLETVQRLLKEAEEYRLKDDGELEFKGLEREVSFEGVEFRYDKQPEATLADVDLTLAAGSMTVLVGHSGAGKSTLVKLLPRLLDPNKGHIYLDGIPLESFQVGSLRKSIAFVTQDDFIFDLPVADNIRYDRLDASDDEVDEAARRANIKDFISSLHDGYATRVGERGSRLSGGERKRMAIARALAKRASIIILDEPTAGLDPDSEGYVLQTIQDLRASGEATLLVIAHRPTTVQAADQVVVMEKGRVVWVGSPEAYESRSWAEAGT